MKYIKVIATVAFFIGLILVFCAVGTDDFYEMELHQPHTLNYTQIIIGLLLCIPFPVILNKEEKQ